MPFGLWARMGRRNHVLDGGPAVLRDVAMATNFVTQFVITGFVGYNFGCMIACMIASDTQFYSRGGFSGSSYPMKTIQNIADLEVLRHVAMATIFGFLYMGARWRHLANTTEPSMCCGDTALCQITLTTCYYYYLRQLSLILHQLTVTVAEMAK